MKEEKSYRERTDGKKGSTVYLEPEVWHELKIQAAMENTSRNNLLVKIVNEYLAKHKR